MTTLIEKSILNERLEKSRSGTYSDTSENRRKHRVGQKYGSEKKEEEKPEKTDSNKMSPEQQLEAINKVIAAVNEGKLKLPPEEINTLVAKKTMAEEAVKQAKGEKKPEEKEELDEDGELVTITHDKEKFERYRIFRDLHAARMKRGTSPNLSKMGYLKNSGDVNQKGNEKYYELQKEFGDKKYAFKEKIQEGKPKEETEESYTRVKFEDVPNSGKVNLKKYLSEKMKRSADEAWGDISKIDTKGLQKMEKGLVEDFNRQFDDLPKSRRAEKLYAIIKVKGELSKRGKESQKKE